MISRGDQTLSETESGECERLIGSYRCGIKRRPAGLRQRQLLTFHILLNACVMNFKCLFLHPPPEAPKEFKKRAMKKTTQVNREEIRMITFFAGAEIPVLPKLLVEIL